MLKTLNKSFFNKLGYIFFNSLIKSDFDTDNLARKYYFLSFLPLSLSDKDEKGRFFPDNGELNLDTASLF